MSGLYELLLTFDPHGLRDAAKSWKALAHAADGVDSRHRTQVNGPLRLHWQGGDATAAFAYMERTEQQLDIVRVEAETVALTLNTVADRMYQAQTNLTNAVHRAQEAGLTVSVEGVVDLPAQTWDDRHDQDTQDARRALASARSTYQDRINTAVKAAQDASDQGRTALGRLAGDILGEKRGNGGMAETGVDAAAVMSDLGLAGDHLPDGKDPKKSADWWKGLTPEQQESFLALRPAELGRMDGLPSTVRDKANRLVLDQKLDALQAGSAADAGLDQETYQKRRDALETIKRKLDEKDGNDEAHQLFLLAVDPEAYDSDGRAIVATGNPDKAQHTAVFVPGTNTDLNGVPGQIDRVQQLQKQAESLTRAGEAVSVISYLGYDTPESLPEASNPMRGIDGAKDMRQFSEGLRVTHGEPKSHVTYLAHSYGSYAVGVAASQGGGLHADDIVALGSPGMGVLQADQLNIDPDHVWIGEADDDPTRLVGGATLGPSPHIWGFGGNNIEIDTEGHGGYWNDRSTSLLNQAKIIAGLKPSTSPKEPPVLGQIPLL
ncbi:MULTISPECIES: alpha/beta hydrolase [unclassified Kitasatospora]|uniref:alpha/beta hydrolase n=1 Tax=unclassified Kitasatospora TaxID=2633591 RepID=UPI00380F529B